MGRSEDVHQVVSLDRCGQCLRGSFDGRLLGLADFLQQADGLFQIVHQ